MKKVNTEPVAIGAVVNGGVSAVLAVCAAFGVWKPTPDQVAAVLGLSTALEAMVAVFVRRRVSPVGSEEVVA